MKQNRAGNILGLLAVILVLTGSSGLLAGATGDFVPEELVCQMMPGYDVDSINATYGTSVKQYLSHTSTYLLQTQPGQNAESLAAIIQVRPDVFFCDANYLLDAPEAVQSSQPFLDATPSLDPLTQPAATTLQLTTAQSTTTGSDVVVGVIDVGVDLQQPALATNVISGFDYVANDTVADDEAGGSGSGHGTFIAGIVNLVAPDADIVAYRVLDTAGRGDGFTIAEAVLQAVDDGCKVINLSCVMSGKNGALDIAIEYAKNHNVMVIAAAGNDSSNVELFPASDSYVLAVASLDSNDQKSAFSNYGGKIDICAPGRNIYAPFLDTTYAWWDGTSFAAPFVAGTAALIYAVRPQATWDEVREALRSTAVDIDDLNPAYAGLLGKGRIDPVAAIQFAQQLCCVGATGNIDTKGVVDLTDLSYLIAFLTGFAADVPCPAEANINNLGVIDLTDLSLLIAYLTVPGTVLPACQ